MIRVEKLLAELGIVGRRQGRELWAPCPHKEHKESKPSWSIVDDPGAPEHGYHRCFGCGRGGGPLGLIRAVRGWEAPGGSKLARELIADKGLDEAHHGPLPSRVQIRVRYGPPPFVLPPALISGLLSEWPAPARAYALERGINEAQAERWGLMCAVDGRLGGRLVIPIADEAGRIGSYSARTFIGGEPRYLTPARDEHPVPGAMFGRRYWPLHGAPRQRLVLTEGALDALACERAGAPYVAALGGGAASLVVGSTRMLDPRVAVLLLTWAEVVIATDQDEAGERLAAILAAALGRHIACYRARWPKADGDANSMPRDDLANVLAISA